MKIDPCPCIMSLKDGSNHTLFEFRHFLELVELEMGVEAAKWLETHVSQLETAADYTQAKVETDLDGYEASLDSNKTAFMDIQKETGAIIENFLDSPRINWKKIAGAVENIRKIIENQI